MTELFFPKTSSSLTSAQLIAKEKANMDTVRFEHCVRVSRTARKLAEQNQFDPDKAALAGFVHDYAKQMPEEAFRTAIVQEKMSSELLKWNRSIWHGTVGWFFVQRDLKINDAEILTAIRRHTTGDVEMTTLDKIVFLADYIEPGRDFEGVEQARQIGYADLNAGVGYELAHTLAFLIKKRAKVYPKTLAAYNVWAAQSSSSVKKEGKQ